jgi:phosphoglycerate dehydrogenase-like enzyme
VALAASIRNRYRPRRNNGRRPAGEETPVPETFRVALTGDFRTPDGRIGWGDIGLSQLDAAENVSYSFLEDRGAVLRPGQLAGVDALIGLLPRVSAASLADAADLKVVARFGVGYDNVDVDACTGNGTLVTITRDAVRRPVASAALALLLSITHRLPQKDDLVRTGRWHDRLDHMGTGLTGKVVGFVGWGNTGGELSRLLAPLDVRQVAHDPYASPEIAAGLGVELRSLEEVQAGSDVVVIMAALTPQTRGIIGPAELATMKPTAMLVNISRGPLVDQQALAKALTDGQISGAALDVFADEPVDPADPILRAPNTLLTPHAACWTDELAWNNGTGAIGSVLAVAAGRVPPFVVNPDALRHPKLAHLAS